MENFWDSFWGKTVRWIAVLPLATLIGLIGVPIFFVLQEWVTNWFIGRVESGFFQLYLVPLLLNGFAAFTFVYVGVYTAPNYKRSVSIILGFLLAILYSLLVYGLIKYELLWSNGTLFGLYFIVWVLVCFAGIGAAIWKTWDEH